MLSRLLKGGALVALALASFSRQAHAAVLIGDDFSTFANGNLVGQNGWGQVGASATLPIQVSGGQVVIPGGQTGDNQDASKPFGTTMQISGETATITVTGK